MSTWDEHHDADLPNTNTLSVTYDLTDFDSPQIVHKATSDGQFTVYVRDSGDTQLIEQIPGADPNGANAVDDNVTDLTGGKVECVLQNKSGSASSATLLTRIREAADR